MEVEVGAVKLKSALPNVFVGIVKLVRVGVLRDTVNVVVVDALAKLAVDACVAVIVVTPMPTIVMVLPDMVATAVLLDV